MPWSTPFKFTSMQRSQASRRHRVIREEGERHRPRVVDQHVDGTEARESGGSHRVHLLAVRDVGRHREDIDTFGAKLGFRLRELWSRQVDGDDATPACPRQTHELSAESARGPGDHDDLAFQMIRQSRLPPAALMRRDRSMA